MFNREPTKVTRRYACALLAGVAGGSLSALPMSAASGPVTSGFNVPLWLDSPDPGTPPTREVLIVLHELGFRSVRLPISPRRSGPSGGDRRARQQEVLRAVGQLTGLGYSVTLDMHPRPSDGLAQSAELEADLVRAWSELAELAADQPDDMVLLELLNEPPMGRDRWMALRSRLADVIRRRCPRHTIIWGANRFQSLAETLDCPPLSDPLSMVAVHYYWPMAFTHQCRPWAGAESLDARFHGLPFPATPETPEVKAVLDGTDEAAAHLRSQIEGGWSAGQIDGDFARLAEWARANRTAVVVNEFAANKMCVDRASRAYWTRAVRESAERHGIGWTYWELDRGFGFMIDRKNPGEIDWSIIRALFEDRRR